ncbi:L,D-transpeptidase family protein [Maricaulis sp. CAU 1757]
MMTGKRLCRVFARRTTAWLAMVLAAGAAGAGLADDEGDLVAATTDPVRAGLAEAVAGPSDYPVWFPDPSLWNDDALRDLALALSEAATHGLPDMTGIAVRLHHERLDREARARLATQAFYLYAGWLEFGVLDGQSMRPRELSVDEQATLAARLGGALRGGSMRQVIAESMPRVSDYDALRRELVRMRTMPPIWPFVEPGPSLGLGDSGERVDQVRARLTATGLLTPDWREGEPFDVRLETAVRRYQGRANLDPNGRVDAATLRQLNVAPGDRLRQLRANLEQRRWRTRQLGERHIWVNLADFRLEAWEDGVLARVHEVMVGKQVSSTPEFSDEMEYLVLNPWWNLPSGLARPRFQSFRRNPGLAEARGFRIYNSSGTPVSIYELDWSRWGNGWPYRLSQPPGEGNPMGEVKFMFPNAHNIYIHDTIERDQFYRTRRDFSAGCIRVQNPLELAEWVLSREAGWSRERIDAVVAGSSPTVVRVESHIPVHIAYWTVVADAAGEVRYLHDLYRRDPALQDALSAALEAADTAVAGLLNSGPATVALERH